jgi:heme/copper-type cytochrome/quinol oxidase subunit 3
MTMADAMTSADGNLTQQEVLNAARLGAHWTGSRLFVALSAMFFAAGGFSYFYLRSLNNNGLWRIRGQVPSPFIALPVLLMTLAAAAMYLWTTRRLLRDRTAVKDWVNDWRVASAVSAALFLGAAITQFWGLRRLNFFPGSSGYASLYVAIQPMFGLWLLIGFYWVEVLLARSLRHRQIVTPVAGNENSADAVSFAGSLEGSRTFVWFLALLALALYLLFSVLK